MSDLLKNVEWLSRGLVKAFIPDIARGAFLDLWHSWDENVDKVEHYVKNSISLWEKMEESDRKKLKRVGRLTGNFKWLTAEWVVRTIRDTDPAVASLLQFDESAHSWLAEQVEDLKSRITEGGFTR